MTHTLMPGHERHDGEYCCPIFLTTTALDDVVVIATRRRCRDNRFACQHCPSYMGWRRACAVSLHWQGGMRGVSSHWHCCGLTALFLAGSPHRRLMWDSLVISCDVDVTSLISCDVDVTLPISCDVDVASPILCNVDVTWAMW
jgi:hypothetical protein